MSDLLSGFPTVVTLPVLWGEMDALGHVNNVVYFRYFESARIECFRRLDWFGGDRQGNVGPILASTEARYRKPLTYPDTVHVGTNIIDVAADRFTMLFRIVGEKLQAVAAEGQGVIVAFDYKEGKKVLLPEELRQRIATLGAASG